MPAWLPYRATFALGRPPCPGRQVGADVGPTRNVGARMALTTERVKIVKQLSILLDDANLTYPMKYGHFRSVCYFILLGDAKPTVGYSK